MSSKYFKRKLGECVNIITGFPFKSDEFNTIEEGIRLVRGKNVTKGSLRWGEDTRYWSNITDDHLRYLLQENDVVIGMDGSLVGKNYSKISKKDLPLLLVQRVAALRALSIVRQEYIFYLIDNERFISYIDSIKTGTSIPHISAKQIKDFEILLPPLDDQDQIISILQPLYDKIELNNSINSNLEEMAQILFKRWFVDFEFPNKNGEPFKSSGGKTEWSDELATNVPTGWIISKLDDLIESVSETYKFTNNDVIFLNTSDILNGDVLHQNYSNPSSLPGQAKKGIAYGDILYSEIRPNNKRFALIDFDANEYVVSTKFMVLRSKPSVDPIIMYYFLTSKPIVDFLQILAESRSGTFPQITFQQLKDIKIAIPPADLLNEFTRTLKSIYNKIQNNRKQIKHLSHIRDALLPKLMFGEIQVSVE